MRRLTQCCAALIGLALLGAASLAHAEPTVNNPMPVYIQQGKRISSVSVLIASGTTQCMIAPTGTTCTPSGSPTAGSNTTRLSDGALGFMVQNIGANAINCSEFTPVPTATGILLAANGGIYTEAIAARSMTLYCRAAGDTNVTVVRYLP